MIGIWNWPRTLFTSDALYDLGAKDEARGKGGAESDSPGQGVEKLLWAYWVVFNILAWKTNRIDKQSVNSVEVRNDHVNNS